MDWFDSDEIPDIPAEILDQLEPTLDLGDCSDVADFNNERSYLQRVVAINQQLRRQVFDLESDLHTANTYVESLKDQVRDLVSKLHRLGYSPSHKPLAR